MDDHNSGFLSETSGKNVFSASPCNMELSTGQIVFLYKQRCSSVLRCVRILGGVGSCNFFQIRFLNSSVDSLLWC